MKKAMYSKGNQKQGLTPITSPWMHQLMEQPQIIQELFKTYGSPLNILHPKSLCLNREKFQDVFKELEVDGQIFYARKANKAKAFVAQALADHIGVDTASTRELSETLTLGASKDQVVLTAAIKTEDQLQIALENEVVVMIDNDDESKLINRLAKEMGVNARVAFRLSGFTFEDEKLYSRFGFDVDSFEDYITQLVGQDKAYTHLQVEGFHFHLDGYSIPQRSDALLQCIKLIRKLKNKGFEFRFIDMGGGILINYLASQSEWKNFDHLLKESLRQETAPVTFNYQGLGYWLEDGQVKGKRATYPYYNQVHGEQFLKEVLSFKTTQGKSLAELLNKEKLQIRIEPGRSLVNQAGITMAKVIHRKQDAKGQWLVGLEMNMSQMMSSSADFMLDPYVMYQNLEEEEAENAAVEVYFTGAYCLERDILLKRKITLPQLPAIGDIVVFVNTAGYMMHFFETEAHLFELAPNLVFTPKSHQISTRDFVKDADI
ncbi:alanine racemase [Mesonia aestuariivivens]|uniref:Y4yA family PLP-dependent enzyme n=1 Tax=Mesonia aestuariivivens TaxID=2796128 RepID=A0ABS6W520_9FLAO|nr:alanine racemase [Mesonia aestuariivivens]MBW2962962.1 Y4yA family PLP-dependent enzyme [Mesonia aestuariivivens]